MKRRKLITIAVTLGLFLAIASGLLVSSIRDLHQPSYGGKTLGEWLANRWVTNSASGYIIYGQTSKESDEAIRKIGTNGIPTLLRMIEANDSAFKMRLGSLLARKRLITYRDSGWLRGDAMHAFTVLGTNAASAVPELIRIYQNADPSLTTRNCVAVALGYIGPQAREALSMLLKEFSDTNSYVRYHAALAVRRIGGDPAVLIPAFRAALQRTAKLDGDELAIRSVAAEALGDFGREAEEAVPDLLANYSLVTEAGNPDVARQCMKALWKIAPERVPKAFLKDNENFQREMQWETNPGIPRL